MKITIIKDNLKKVLGLVSHTVGTTVTLPILGNILLQTDKGRLKISATNLELGLTVWLGGQVDEEGSVTIPARIVSDYVNSTLGEKIQLITQENNILNIKTDNSSATVKTLPFDEFPLIPTINSIGGVKLLAEDIKNALLEVVFASSIMENRPELAGVYLYIENSQLVFVATDGYRLVEKRVGVDSSALEGEFKPLVIPIKTAQEIIRIISSLGGSEVNMEIKQGENQILCKFAELELVSRVLEAQFPDYKELIPQEFKSEAVLPRYDLVQAIKSTSLFASSSRSVKIGFKPNSGNIEITAVSGDLGESMASLSGSITGGEQEIVYNYKYLVDYLNSISDDKVILKVNNETSPTIITPEKRKDNLYLVMPVKS